MAHGPSIRFGRHLTSLLAVSLTVTLLSASPRADGSEAFRVAACDDKHVTAPDNPELIARQGVIVIPPAKEWFLCGGPSAMAIGPRAGSAPSRLPAVPWGTLPKASGMAVVSATSVSVLNDLIRSQAVPDVRADTRTAIRHRDSMYGVYQIWVYRRTIGNTFKYGITRVGPSRPSSQVGVCQHYYRSNSWTATGIGSGEASRVGTTPGSAKPVLSPDTN